MMMAEGKETPDGEAPRRTEGDLLAERRARRAMNSDPAHPDALIRRAEAAEATVQTLETHLASLQQRLEEAEEETRRMSELLQGARVAGAEHEHELRRAKQREYAEQRLRVEAEDRCSELDRESRAAIDRLSRRVSASERDARKLASRLQSVQRELAEAEQAVAAERAVVRGAERELKERLTELEQRTVEIHRGLEAERAARERAERQLEHMRLGHHKMEDLVRELNGGVSRLRIATTAVATQEPAANTSTWEVPQRKSSDQPGEMADALAAAFERLRARVEESPAALEDPGAEPVAQEQPPTMEESPAALEDPGAEPVVQEQPPTMEESPAALEDPGAEPVVQEQPPTMEEPAMEGLQAAPGEPPTAAGPPGAPVALERPFAQENPAAPAEKPPPHKHTRSLIGRLRIARKERRARRSTTAQPPTMRSQ